nr:twin-arginine translocase subunit TatC [Halobellus sp. Atlit-38R]
MADDSEHADQTPDADASTADADSSDAAADSSRADSSPDDAAQSDTDGAPSAADDVPESSAHDSASDAESGDDSETASDDDSEPGPGASTDADSDSDSSPDADSDADSSIDAESPAEVDAAATVDELTADDDAGDSEDGESEDGDLNDSPTGDGDSDDTAPADDANSETPDPDSATSDPDVDADTTDSDADTDDPAPATFDPDAAAPEAAVGDDPAVADTDGGAPANAEAGPGPGAAEISEPGVDEGFVSEGPESDEEMPLAAHIEEMIRRLAVVLGIGGIVTLLLYPGADLVNSAFGLNLVSSTEVIDFLWNKHIPGAPEMVDRRPRVYGPLELLLTELKVAALGGLVVGLPAFVYETYLFMRPGLYPKERRYYLAAVPTSLILAFVGISFAHFLVLPAIFAYFTSYTTGTALVAFGLKETFNLILILMGYNAIIFQIPLFVMLAIMMNLVTRRWLEDRRLLFWGTFLGLAFLVSPDPTGMAPIIIGATMITLFEGTLFVLRWTGRGSLAPTAEGLAARRPYAAVLAALVGYLLSSLPAPTGYYDLLPSVAVETLTANGLAVYTPLIIAGVLVGVFELVSLLLRRYGRSRRMLRARLAVDTARRPVWLLAVVVGYLGSPDPAFLQWVTELNLRPALAGGIAVGLVLGYEVLRLLLAAREDRAA